MNTYRTQPPKQENSKFQRTLDELHEFYRKMMSDLRETYQDLMEGRGDSEKIELISKSIKAQTTMIQGMNTLIKRDRIERQGYDTHAGIAQAEYKKSEDAKKKAEMEEQQQSDNSEQDVETDGDEQQQPDENPPEMQHLHHDIEEYQENLPAFDKPKEIIKNIEVVAPTPIITYNDDGFRPYAKMRDLFKSHAPIKIAGGTYDAGKTYSCVAYMDMLARQYPGARLTFIHRTLGRIYENIIPTYEKYLGFRPTRRSDKNPTPIVKHGGERPRFFEYWNGSRIYMNGLDNINNLLSDYFDAAFVNQAELVEFDRWMQVTARVSERAGIMPYAFLIADCNPSTPNHWIRQQVQEGNVEYFELSFRDNPEIYNQTTGELTESGERRVSGLQKLSGLLYKRGYEGKWESAEGLVFDTYAPDVHIIDNFELDENWKRYISIDWGFRNPSSCIWWALSPDDRLYAYKEIYKTNITRTDLMEMIEANMDEDEFVYYAAVDSADQDGVEHLKRIHMTVKQPKKSRVGQIDAIKQRLKVDETGKPAIFFFRDRLLHKPDENLKEAYRPLEVTDEFLSCVYDENVTHTDKDEVAIKGDHHGIDSTAYLLLSLEQFSSIGSGRVLHSTNGLDVAEGLVFPGDKK